MGGHQAARPRHVAMEPADASLSPAMDGHRLSTAPLLLSLLSAVLIYWAFLIVGSGWLLLASLVLGGVLIALVLVDLKEFRLPNALTLPLLGAGLIFGATIHPTLFVDHLIGAAAGFLLFAGIAAFYRRLRGRDGLGLGDAKLLAAGGAWLTWQGLPSVLLIASVTALAWALATGRFADQKLAFDPLPFGPALALGIWLVWLYGPISIGGWT